MLIDLKLETGMLPESWYFFDAFSWAFETQLKLEIEAQPLYQDIDFQNNNTYTTGELSLRIEGKTTI